MKTAVLVSSYGTDSEDAKERSLDRIYYDLRKVAGDAKDVLFYQIYTNEEILNMLADKGMKIYGIKDAIEKAIEEGAKRLIVMPTNITAGTEYKSLCHKVMEYSSKFRQIKITRPLLEDEWDCFRQTAIFSREFMINPDKEYILIGRGSDSDANHRYHQMNKAFENSGLSNIRIAAIDAKPDIEDALEHLKAKGNNKKVVIHPFMVASGNRVREKIEGEKDSVAARLKDEGYDVEVILKGLGEYPEFRNIYINRLRAVL